MVTCLHLEMSVLAVKFFPSMRMFFLVKCPVSPMNVSRRASNDPCQLNAKGLVRLCFLRVPNFTAFC